MFFRKYVDRFSNGFGVVTEESRAWRDSYRQRWQHDKIARSTHGTNCTGSCSWKIYVKNGLATWETHQTDNPRTRPDMPKSRAPRVFKGRELFLVSLQRRPPEISDGARAARDPRTTSDAAERCCYPAMTIATSLPVPRKAGEKSGKRACK